MIHRFIDSIRHLNSTGGFEAYLLNLQKNGRTGIPTITEARTDFQKMLPRDPRIVA